MKFFNQYVGLVFISVLFSSCAGMLYTSIDVLRPAKITFPSDIDRILIVNNTIPQPNDYGHITELFNEKQQKVIVEADSLAIFCLAAFTESINEMEFFSSVSVDINSLKKGTDFLSTSAPTEEQIAALTKATQPNGIISLDRILVNDDIAEMYNQEENTFIAYMEARYEKYWSVHFPDKHKVAKLVTKDTVYWESESYYRQRALNGLPVRKDALIDGALITGARDVSKFIPYWETVDRYFFDSRKKAFKLGMNAVYAKDWDGAITYWEDLLAKTKNDDYKAKITHNLAVVFEMKGDIAKAYAYSNQSLEMFVNVLIVNYQHFMLAVDQNNALKSRLADQKLLNRQLGE